MTDKPDDKKPLLATADKALLRTAATGEGGAVELTPDLLESIKASLNERRVDIDERFPNLVKDCPYETRLAVAAWVMKAILEHAKEGGSFRYLIYERLGFGPDAYVPLYIAGGMEISNEFALPEPEKKNE